MMVAHDPCKFVDHTYHPLSFLHTHRDTIRLPPLDVAEPTFHTDEEGDDDNNKANRTTLLRRRGRDGLLSGTCTMCATLERCVLCVRCHVLVCRPCITDARGLPVTRGGVWQCAACCAVEKDDRARELAALGPISSNLRLKVHTFNILSIIPHSFTMNVDRDLLPTVHVVKYAEDTPWKLGEYVPKQ